ncbi:hypothetical protein SAMN05443252_105160 [Bacillus sp. OV322]|nr:hypothetical protein SAMN05443252_105160 [Bacillus sp. OV322]
MPLFNVGTKFKTNDKSNVVATKYIDTYLNKL